MILERLQSGRSGEPQLDKRGGSLPLAFGFFAALGLFAPKDVLWLSAVAIGG